MSGGAPDCPVSQRSPAQRSTAQSAGDAWPALTVDRGTGLSDVHRTVSGVHRTVSGAPSAPKLQQSTAPYLEGNHAPDSYSDCPVVHRTIRCPTPLSILRHPDSVPAHSLRCVRDLSSIRVKDSLCCHLSSSLLFCAWVCCDLCLVCVAHPNLTPCFHCDLFCKGERLQSCGDCLQMGIII
jgi:hypothetical protein